MPRRLPPPIEEDRGYCTPCLIDQGATKCGRPDGGRQIKAFEDEYGPLPAGYTVSNLCGVKVCVRASHMEAITRAESVKRRAELRTTCPLGHAYDGVDPKRGYRTCSICLRNQDRDKGARYRANRKWNG